MYLKNDHTLSAQFVDQIYQLQRLSGGITEMHALGERANILMETVQKQKKLRQLPTAGNEKIRHLILVDRAVDFSSLFVTPLTYEGLIDDVREWPCLERSCVYRMCLSYSYSIFGRVVWRLLLRWLAEYVSADNWFESGISSSSYLARWE